MAPASPRSGGLCTKRGWMKWTTFLGVYLLNFWTQVSWMWGNLSVYTYSYFRYMQLDTSDVQGPWMTGIFYICWSMGLMLPDKLLKKVPKRLVILLGFAFTNGGMFLSYLAVQKSPTLLVLTLGAVTGMGSGIIYALEYSYIMEWTDTCLGLATSSLQSILTLSTVCANVMITFYINPDNLATDTFNGHVRYFTQEEVVSRVPRFFLLLGCMSLIFNITGFVLIRDKPTEEEEEEEDSDVKQIVVYSNCKECQHSYTWENDSTCHKSGRVSDGEETEHTRTSGDDAVEEQSLVTYQMCCYDCLPGGKDQKRQEETESLSPLEVLKTYYFYALTVSNMATDVSFINVSTYFKTYGSLYIADDHFLASIATVTCVTVCVAIAAFGAMSDVAGVKTTSITACSAMTVLSAFYYVTPRINQWLFMVFSSIYCGCVFGLYNMIMVATLRIFGPEHFTTNYGMVTVSSVLVNVLVPPLTQMAIVQYGWTFMYLAVSVINFGTLLIFILGIPQV